MTMKRLLLRVPILCICVLLTHLAFSQTKIISGTITDDKGIPIQGATISVKGTNIGTTTDAKGGYSLSTSGPTKTLIVSSVGYGQQEVTVGDKSAINITMSSSTQSLNDVVVIGYGTARRKDLSGSFSTVTAKNLNAVPTGTPDQLLQGKVAGLEITVSNGQPGAQTVVKIRGNNSIRANTNPLYVVDGVPLDGRSARPGSNVSGLGITPDANPLTYLNGSDIESITVLKDASASAIYGSRGANGVILITTRGGTTGPLRVDANAYWTLGSILTPPDVLDAGQYRQALAKYDAKSDSGASYDPFSQITQSRLAQNYSVALSGGSGDNGRYRGSFLASSTPGLIKKSNLDRYIANFNGNYKFLDKKLTLTYGITAGFTNEQIAPISNNPGSTGSVISNALQWNPTLLMQHADGSYVQNPNGQINPLLFSRGYNDFATVSTVLANMTAAYKILPFLEYKFLYGLNYSTGIRDAELLGYVVGTGGNNLPDANGRGGEAYIGGAQLSSQTITHTLTYNKDFTNDLNLTALVGYEYWTTSYKTQSTSTYGFDYNNSVGSQNNLHLWDNIQDGLQKNLLTSSSYDPSVETQSYFARVALNYQGKYSLTGSIRSDGSSKFGANNKYAYFPAVSGKWTISQESFMKDGKIFSNLALRAGWGQTGNQEFPAGAALWRTQYTSSGTLQTINFANPNLKWETVTATNLGLDFSILNNRLTAIVDWYNKKTTDPLFPAVYAAPAPSGTVYENLNGGYISNKGFEITLNGIIVQSHDWTWMMGVTYNHNINKFVDPSAGTAPLVLTGQLNGKGTSATYVQAIANNQPIDVFYLRTFHGFDQNGFSITDPVANYSADPNPHDVIGFNTEVDYKKFSLTINGHGAYNFFLYNNTLQAVTGLAFIKNGSNISKTLIGTTENPANPVSASTRYLSKGDFFKLGNMTLRYNLGQITPVIKNVSVYGTVYNLFVITPYSGFDPEVNVSTADINGTGVPSRNIDYVGFPSIRSYTLGVNFSLY
jgi:TonB-dependent starch-binding outer membrane protein SusC